MRWLIAAGALLMAASPALAQDDLDLDADGRDKDRKTRDSLETQIIREIERGFYVKANVGSTFYVGNRRDLLSAGTSVALSIGNDFQDNEKSSAAYEFTVYQAIHNGAPFDSQDASVLGQDRLIQGDTHTFGLMLGANAKFFPSRRVGFGIRGGGGVMFSPLIIESQAYDEIVVGTGGSNPGAWDGVRPPIHDRPHGVVYAGPTFEYFTKLSHFSVGIDVDVLYAFGIDLGVTASGYLKYSF